MKTVMKKLFSLMLVAVLLVSAVPTAFAAEGVVNCPNGHEAEFVSNHTDATCSADQVVVYKCKTADCHYAGGWYYTLAGTKLSHTEVTDAAVAATCSATGLTEGKHCSVCNEVTVAQTVVPKLAHTEVTDAAVAATCSATGLTEGKHCSVCNEVIVAQTETAKLDHTYVSTITTAPTCSKKGVRTYICTACNYSYPEDIATVDHTMVNNKCSVCGFDANVKTFTVVFNKNEQFNGKGTVVQTTVVKDGYSVSNPGFGAAGNWDALKSVTDIGDYAFLGWSTDPNAKTADFSTNSVVYQGIKSDTVYYAIYKEVAVDPPTSSRPGNITNKDNSNKVYLHIYLNGNAATEVHSTDLMELYLMDDDKVSNAEVLRFVSDYYYTAKDSNGMEIDGLYVNTGDKGTFPQMYYTDNKVDEISGINAMRDDGHVHISVMIKNAMRKDAVKNNYTADSSNPKTGDTIMAPVAVMGLSVSALAVLFYLNKKRAF